MWQGFGSGGIAGVASGGEGKTTYIQSYGFSSDALDDESKFPPFSLHRPITTLFP